MSEEKEQFNDNPDLDDDQEDEDDEDALNKIDYNLEF